MKEEYKKWILAVIFSMLTGSGYFYSFFGIGSTKLSLLFSFAISGLTGAFLILLLQKMSEQK